MSHESTRRGFIRTAGVGVAAGTALVAVPGVAGALTTTSPSKATEPMMAFVSDPSKGEVTVMVGERETVVVDHDLVARLVRAIS